jgi:hypothetical protein
MDPLLVWALAPALVIFSYEWLLHLTEYKKTKDQMDPNDLSFWDDHY